MTVPTYLPYFVMTGTAAMLVAVLYGLNRSLVEAAWPTPDRARTMTIAATILGGWLAVSIALAASGFYHVQSGDLPKMQFGLIPPILIGAYLIWRSENVRRIIDAVPQAWLVGVQLYRALGVIFLILYATDKLPGLFALPAGLGDIAIGLTAPIVGLAYAKAPSQAAGLVQVWNLLGILDLVVAVSTGFVTAPSRLFPIDYQPNSDLMTVFPMVLIPVYLVPLSIVLHLASLAKLHRDGVRAVTK